MTSTKTPLPGYEHLELLHSSSRTLVYRSLCLVRDNTVIIKLLNCEYPTFSEIVNFRNQYTIAKNLDFSGIVKPLALEYCGNRLALVMEDFGGISLSEYIAKRALSLEEFLHLAIALCQILEGLYRHRIVHKDIKPSNIIIHPDSKQIKLTDFSISSLLPRETQVLQSPNILEGTLAYISPEQTGRMNRGIDYRSDFYALGVTFYQLLTGQLPFVSDDPMELVHCHIAKIPTPPVTVKNDIPQAVSDLVIKLMAKTAERRYQSALGLKYDLEKCLSLWQKTGKIEQFELGRLDISDRFLIPEKLYGRETEVQTLLQAFYRVTGGTCELMLVAGFSGIGKTAAINEVHKPIVRQRGYFIKGKFDQFQRNIPFSAFVQAFRDLMGQLLGESDAQLKTWKSKILAALGENGQVIIEVIPELERIIGQQPPIPELSGSAAQNRFNLLFQKFIRVFTTPDHPLVMFIDDLQWADSASLKLMQLLMSDLGMGYLLLLGAYRDNEVFPAHPLMLTVDEIAKSGAAIDTITLAPLSLGDLNRLVADTLSCQLELALPLTELIHQKTKGNPFFATQFLKGLHEDGWIEFALDVGYWQCDLARVRELALTDDVVEFMATRLYKLPTETQQMLKLAACIGNQFDLGTLAVVSERSRIDVATCLWVALQEGLLLPLSETYKFFQGTNAKQEEKISLEDISVGYNFLHDRVQQAAYSLIRETQKQAIHLKIGQLLLRGVSATEKEEKLFDIVNHLNLGKTLVIRESERSELAELNFQAARKAKTSTAYEAAVDYASTGLNLLSVESWTRTYELTLNLHIEAVEVEYLSTNFERAERLSQIVLDRARRLLDRVKVYILKIQFFIASNQLVKAVETALPVLEKIGHPLVQTPEALRAIAPLPAVEDLDKIPQMTDPYQLAALQLLAIITGPAYMGQPQVLPYIIFKLVNLSLEYGHSVLAAYAYGMYSLLLCGPLDDIEMGYHSGLLSLQLLEKFHAQEFTCKIHLLFNMIRHWKERAKNCRAFTDAIQKGLEIGDIVYASYCSMWFAAYLFFMGEGLDEVETKQGYYAALMQKYKQDYSFYPIAIWRQLALNLQGRVENVLSLTGESFNEGQMQQLCGLENRMVLFFAYLAKLILLYTMRDGEAAVQNAHLAAHYEDAAPATMLVSGYRFYDSLARLALYAEASTFQQEQILETVTINQEKMRKWSDSAPENYQHKYDLVEAEKARCLGQNWEACQLYDRAIAGAKENEYIQEEALANELVAEFYLYWGKEKIARTYIQEAYYCYSRWGAKAKVEDLEKRYSALINPIFERQKLGLTTSVTISTLTTGTGELLDLATLMKASRTLSENIELEGAIANLMQVVRENAGAETAALMLLKEQVLMLTATVTGTDTLKIDPIPVETTNVVPLSIVNTVKHGREPLLLENASQKSTFAGDAYIQQYQTKSILCLPLINRGQPIGILYLENNQVAGAFTSDRLDVLNLLCSQAAISLENAQLYQQSQQALTDLQQAQLQLVQSEKMATLGNLVAGVGHEINNPVGFIVGNINAAQRHLQDLLNALKLYQRKYPSPDAELTAALEELDIDFIAEDFPKLIDSMRSGVERIRHISTSLRTFSRKDTERKTAFNLHEGIDSTLLILKYRLKANERRPAIEIIKEYGNLPEIRCYPGQLNQVFMNLLGNAIDALEEAREGCSFQEIVENPQQIRIKTEVMGTEAMVRISDNGKGMEEEVKARIFEQGFTTKDVGKGTGLGMAIAKAIVEEKHGGAIACLSELGKGSEFTISLPLD